MMHDPVDKPAKRRGRPPMERPERKIANITFRVRDGMRERLEASAKARGLSISEDVEKRIEASFQEERLVALIEAAVERAFAARDGR